MFKIFSLRAPFTTAVIAACFAFSSLAAFAHPAPSQPGGIDDFSLWQGHSAQVHLSANRGSGQAMRVRFKPAQYPNAAVTPEAPWDLTGRSLVITLHNPSRNDVKFYIRADDDPGADGIHHCRTGYATIFGKRTTTFSMALTTAGDFGMRGVPPAAPGAIPMSEYGSEIDVAHIVQVQIFLVSPTRPVDLTVESFQTAAPLPLAGIVDRFGQYTGADWPGKVHSESDLIVQRDAEAQEMAQRPTAMASNDIDAYGGWQTGPQLATAPAFRTARVEGKWWLVTPAGHLFFSIGMDTMSPDSRTFTGGDRARMFTWLPKPGEPLYDHVHQDTNYFLGKTISGADFDFYGANLERKYGPNYVAAWQAISLARLRSWGFNTIGNWSDAMIPDPDISPSASEGGGGRIPYVVPIGAWGSHDKVSAGYDYWGQMDDPWDPGFERDLDRDIAYRTPNVAGDPYCIGYFVGNELSWCAGSTDAPRDRYGLAYGALALDAAKSPAKAAFVADLRKEYATIADLNAAWQTTFDSWDALSAPFEPTGDPTDAMTADLAAYVRHFADQYFRVVSTDLKKADPSHLYLGCRFAWYTPDVVAEAAKYCDVVSFNIYARTVDPQKWGFLNNLGKPCLIGEFHFGALDRGMFSPGLVAAAGQAGRGKMFETYIRSALAMPALVGAHWFQYTDEPLTGRWDGENYNIGFVSQADTPYRELIDAARHVNSRIYTIRHGGKEN